MSGNKYTGRKQGESHTTAIVVLTLIVIVAIVAALIVWLNDGGFSSSENEDDSSNETSLVDETSLETETETETEDAEALAQEAALEESEEKLSALETELNTFLETADGTYGIYIQDLSTGCELEINNEQVYAASLIKLFVMESTYENMETIVEYDVAYTYDEDYTREKIDTLLTNMITASDNESYNELVRMHSSSQSFTEGCLYIEENLIEPNYPNTGIYHTLHPSNSEYENTSDGSNYTSAEDCGHLLADIYNGTCVSEEASEEMLELLLAQERTTKIPAGVPDDVTVANKTGETDDVQHDAAIVFGEDRDYVIVVTSYDFESSSNAVTNITEISSMTYEALNGSDETTDESSESTEETEESTEEVVDEAEEEV